ncbi:MAG: hypothetical protein RLZZ488_2106 [Pseudomonadota bacterium]|jgi:hypothetical protein
MNAYNCFSLVSLLLVVSACGSADFNGGENPAAPNGQTPAGSVQTDSTSPVSFSVASVSALPTCNDARTGSLGYVRAEKKFYVCENSAWAAADILPKDSFEIVGRWNFHVDSFVGEPDVSETEEVIIKIGDIEVVKYANGSSWFSFSGHYFTSTLTSSGPGDNFYSVDFTHSGVISNSRTQTERIFKISTGSNERLRFKVDFSSATPVVKVAHDVNGNFTDYPEQAYPLSEEPL